MKTYRRHQPSGFNMTEKKSWKTLLKGTSNYFLRIFGEVARRKATKTIALEQLKAYIDCKLVILEETPGYNPTSMSEVIRYQSSRTFTKWLTQDVHLPDPLGNSAKDKKKELR